MANKYSWKHVTAIPAKTLAHPCFHRSRCKLWSAWWVTNLTIIFFSFLPVFNLIKHGNASNQIYLRHAGVKKRGFSASKYRVSPIIRPIHKIRPSVIFEDDFNVSPTLKISPSWERQKDERVKHSFFVFIQTDLQDIPEDDDMIVFE